MQGQRSVLMLLRTVGPLATLLSVRREKSDDELPTYEAALRTLCTRVHRQYVLYRTALVCAFASGQRSAGLAVCIVHDADTHTLARLCTGMPTSQIRPELGLDPVA